ENVYKLPAGYRLLASRNDGVRTERYWDVRFAGSGPIGEDDAAVELKERLLAAVEGQLMSEVPLGAFLSGGVDSSAVVASMARLSAEPVNTCSISFGDPAYNESKYARLVAERYRTSHVERQVDPDDFSLLDTLASIYDEPFADSSA